MSRFSAQLRRDVKAYPKALRAAGWFTGHAGRTYHVDGAVAASAPETQAVFDKYKLVTFPNRLDYVKIGSGSAARLPLFPAHARLPTVSDAPAEKAVPQQRLAVLRVSGLSHAKAGRGSRRFTPQEWKAA